MTVVRLKKEESAKNQRGRKSVKGGKGLGKS